MANFNEKVKCGIGYILNSQDFFIYRTGTMKEFERMIHDELYLLTNTYRLFIASQDDCEGFGNTRFDAMESAILITDRYVVVSGDVQIEADDISKDKKHVICTVSLCGSIVSSFRIPSEVFDHFFGLKENFPDQYEKVFGKTEDAKPVQEENDLIEEAKRNIESCMNLLDTQACQLERAMDAIKAILIDIEDQKCELGVMLSKLDDTLRKLK